MSEFLFYGIDEAGEAAYCEVSRGMDREALMALARERLSHWGAVEIWEGPVCLVRLRRSGCG